MRRTVFISLAEFPLLNDSIDHIDYTSDEEIDYSNNIKREWIRAARDTPQNTILAGGQYQHEPSIDPVPMFRKLSISESRGTLGGDSIGRTDTSNSQTTSIRNNSEYQHRTPNNTAGNLRKSSPLPPTTRRSGPSPSVHADQSGIRRSIDVRTTVDKPNHSLHDNRRINTTNRGTPSYIDRMSNSNLDSSPSLVTLDDQRHDLEMRRILAKREERRRLSDGEQSRLVTPEVHSRQQRTPNMMSSPSSSRADTQRRPSVSTHVDGSRRSTPMFTRVSPAIRSAAPNSSERRAAELWNRMVSEGNQ